MDLFGSDPGPARPSGSPRRPAEEKIGAQAGGMAPLADRMRPDSLEEIVGQDELIGAGGPLREAIGQDAVPSMILWGPPGSGKTTLARLVARLTRSQLIQFSAVLAGIKEIKEIMSAAGQYRRATGHRTLLFVDEIHRFNRAQQDGFLPFVESGAIVLIGATTENPSFEVNAALLSRCAVYTLRRLDDQDIVTLLKRALVSPKGVAARRVAAGDEDLLYLASLSGGDARRALNILELLAMTSAEAPDGRRPIDRAAIDRAAQRTPLLYDKSGEEHYNLISALHKSLRNSDPDASLYWLARMLESGEDPLYLARRMVRFASEDIGLAEPGALAVTLAAKDAFDFLGAPEGHLALAQAAVYLSLAPKSNAVYTAYGEVIEDVHKTEAEPVPLHIRNAVTGLMKNISYGKGYKYAHNFDDKLTDMTCLPDNLAGRTYYQPTDQGFEQRLRQRLDEIRKIRSRPSSSL